MPRKLLFSVTKKDFTIQTFRAGGKGGQHQNKTDSAVRLIHRDSGAVGVSRDSRSQPQNKKIAFRRLLKTTEFKRWHRLQIMEHLNKASIEDEVDLMMENDTITVEVKKDGKWTDKTLL